MTEQEWLACDDPQKLLEFLRGKCNFSERKARLFALACCRRIWQWMPDAGRHSVEICEKYADGKVGQKHLAAARRAAFTASKLPPSALVPGRYALAHSHAATIALFACDSMKQHEPWQVAHWVEATARSLSAHVADSSHVIREVRAGRMAALAIGLSDLVTGDRTHTIERNAHCCYLRDITSKPCCPSPPLPPAILAWNDRTIPRLAEVIYQDRKMPEGTLDNGRLAILADALLDSGCDDEDLIQHFRSEGPHVRGCWALDLILGKE